MPHPAYTAATAIIGTLAILLAITPNITTRIRERRRR